MTTPPPLRLLVLCASTRTGSLNRRLAQATADRLAAAGAEAHLADLDDYPVPLYRGDLEATEGVPDGARRLAADLARHDGVVIVSPEYNYSMPGALKNLLDWVSRIKPWPTKGVDGLLMSASTGAVGGHRGLIALRVPLEGNGMRLHPTMFTLAEAGDAFDADGRLADPAQRDRLGLLLKDFLTTVEAAVHYRERFGSP
ncbi:NAD(P)H-dependent oxidoreductase [Glycomyces sp. TRM65418]|uniref:NADPH-dependent FMN reductase n=1 Tax=Glycomyces sp. TRM65418 TaxID=2867006 RepID=UPI001CE68AFD|nr:NADPH-dependent FMN reductase [Glycomyces sp. TRM65418]MCC3764697.1 NAD(P)H-dependent oxidoreductase [Glycomyces sp. TRM65418]QZD54356.1 NAD(P)H-dependent oxidoreductase [Glycomyces sp. TRM65418]